MTGQELIEGYDILFGPDLRLAHEAVLTYAAEMEPDGWPSIPTLWRFARCYGVDVGELAGLCGVLTYRIGRRTVFCDSRRDPALVYRTTPSKFSRRTITAYGFYVTAATLSERDGARMH